MQPVLPQPEWIQYGSFGLIAFLVLVGVPGGFYVHWLTVNRAFEYHKTIITDILCRHEELERQCREDRNRIADLAESRAEKDRALRHDLNDTLQKLATSVDVMLTRGS